MRTALPCLPCLVRQGLEAASFVLKDPADRERVLRETLRSLAKSDLSLSPPALAQIIHRRIRAASGSEDPYRKAKARSTRLALELLPWLRRRVGETRDPLALALRLAIAGNVIDLGARGEPVINDATRDDAREAGLEGEVELIDNGSDGPGTILDDCSPAFRERFRAAGLIIAKGQGNAETLSGVPGRIFFLFKVKCAVMAARFGLAEGTLALVASSRPGSGRGARRPAGRGQG